MSDVERDQSNTSNRLRGRLPSPGCLFSLLLLASLASCCGWFVWRVHTRAIVIRNFRQLGGGVDTEPAGPEWLYDLADATVGDERAGGLSEITGLTLANTAITDAGLQGLHGMSKLEYLRLDRTKITDAGLANLRGLPNLQLLDLSDTQVTDAGLQHVAGLTSLEWLSLDGTQITDEGLQHLSRLTHMEHLSLHATFVTETGVQKLNEQLPGCFIQFSAPGEF